MVKQLNNREYGFFDNYIYKSIENFDFINRKVQLFRYENLPDKIPHSFMEREMIQRGRVYLCKDKSGLIFATNAVALEYDLYWEPVLIETVNINENFNGLKFTKDDFVIFYNNPMRTNDIFTIDTIVNKISKLETARDINTEQLKTPIIFYDKTGKLGKLFDELWSQVTTNVPFLKLSDKKVVKDSVDIWDTKAPNNLESFNSQINQLKSDLNAKLGLGNTGNLNSMSRRMVVDEVIGGEESSNESYNAQRLMREEAIQEANEKFGLDIKLKEQEKEQYFDIMDREENIPLEKDAGGVQANE